MYLLTKLLERPGLILKEPIQRQIDFYRVRPTRALFFLTFRCNSHCATCTFWTRDKKQLQAGELDIQQWKKVADDLHENGIRSVELFGGNILLRKDLLIPLLHHLRALGWRIYIPTNQIGLDQEIVEALVGAEVHTLFISTDGTDAYQDAIRGFDGATRLNTRAIQAIRQYRDKLGRKHPILVCNTTVSRFNVEILEHIPEYAIAMGFDEVHFEYAGEISEEAIASSLIDGLKPTPMYVKQNGMSILASQQQACEIKKKIALIKQRYLGAPILIHTLNIDDLSERDLYEGTIPHGKCYDERLEVNVDPYGNIVACPMIHNYHYGNLLSDGFKATWNNERHRRFRTLQNCGRLRMCRHCILGVQKNATLWRALRRTFRTYCVDSLRRHLASRSRGPHGAVER